MKPWMKVLFWLGLGGAVGFFAGQQSGYKKAKKEDEQIINDAYARGREDGPVFTGSLTELAESLGYVPKDEEEFVDMETPPEMPEDYDEEPEDYKDPAGDIPVMQYHPSMQDPVIVDEETYYEREDLDEEILLWYQLDDVLYNTSDQKPMGPEDQATSIGIGTINEFTSGPSIKDEVYVINETAGTRFKLQRIEDAFMDAVDGTAAPDDDDYEDDTE